jgi:hypothetical protein
MAVEEDDEEEDDEDDEDTILCLSHWINSLTLTCLCFELLHLVFAKKCFNFSGINDHDTNKITTRITRTITTLVSKYIYGPNRFNRTSF